MNEIRLYKPLDRRWVHVSTEPWFEALRESLADTHAQRRRYGLGPPSALYDVLGEIRNVRFEVSEVEDELVRFARFAGLGWREIGEALNVSKQGAHKRFRHVEEIDP